MQNETQIPEIWETEEDKKLTIGQLKYNYLQIAKQRFQGKIFINKDKKIPIRVSNDGIMEWWRKSRRKKILFLVNKKAVVGKHDPFDKSNRSSSHIRLLRLPPIYNIAFISEVVKSIYTTEHNSTP